MKFVDHKSPGAQSRSLRCNTCGIVDGRNPAPPWMYKLIITINNGIFAISTGLPDFFH